LDGWTSNTPAQISWQSTGGNPDGYLQFADATADSTRVYAPGKFLGSWVGYDAFRYDFTVSNTGNAGPGWDQVKISGLYNGSPATAVWWTNSLSGDKTDWLNRTASLSSPWPNVQSDVPGPINDVWASILNNVTEVNILMDTFNGITETTGLDNARLTPEPATLSLLALGGLALLRRRKRA
jgi:hypothetical protein